MCTTTFYHGTPSIKTQVTKKWCRDRQLGRWDSIPAIMTPRVLQMNWPPKGLDDDVKTSTGLRVRIRRERKGQKAEEISSCTPVPHSSVCSLRVGYCCVTAGKHAKHHMSVATYSNSLFPLPTTTTTTTTMENFHSVFRSYVPYGHSNCHTHINIYSRWPGTGAGPPASPSMCARYNLSGVYIHISRGYSRANQYERPQLTGGKVYKKMYIYSYIYRERLKSCENQSPFHACCVL